MRLLVHEYFTGGGLWWEAEGGQADHSLLREATRLVSSLAKDLSRIDGIQILTLRDHRLDSLAAGTAEVIPVRSGPEELDLLATWAPRVDGTILIGPEFKGRLRDRCRLVEDRGGRLFSPDSAFVELTSDKGQTADYLRQAGILTPVGHRWHPGEPLAADPRVFPMVVKPVDGAGSMDVHVIQSEEQVKRMPASEDSRLVEPYHPGMSASVSALCGPRSSSLLPPCRQNLSTEGRLRYLGGQWPLAHALQDRACRLAQAALRALPATVGYVGLDLVLGDDPEGSEDLVIEVNPRLTTSYLGLRSLATVNLAEAMLAVCRGEFRPLLFASGALEFSVDGVV